MSRVMSLLPTTRINTLSSSNSGIDSIRTLPDEDILLVDFQPVVVPNSQVLLSSPSTTTSTAMYPLPPPTGQLPGAHMIGLNHQPSVSSDGITTPISATGSSGGKVHSSGGPNNFSLVSLSNHAHHNNNTSREESDMSYHPPAPPPHHHLHYPGRVQPADANGAANHNNIQYDEDDEFARHQALAQPSYMTNKRRSRRFTNRDSHIWDNTNHVGHHPHQQVHQGHMSSSLSSSEDSDTGFLMGTRKTAYTRRSVQKVVDPHPAAMGGNLSPSATTGLLPNLGSRKRVRRRRPSARNRKPANSQRDKIPNPSDVLSFCCCLGEDDSSTRSGAHRSSSLRSRYLRLIFVLVAIIVIAVLMSITVSLQRKVDLLDTSLKTLDQALGSPLAADSSNGEVASVHKPKESFEALLSSHNDLNSTVAALKGQVEQVLSKLEDLQKQLASASKQDGVTEVRGELAKLGSHVEELSATIEKLKKASSASENNNGAKDSNSNGGNSAQKEGGAAGSGLS